MSTSGSNSLAIEAPSKRPCRSRLPGKLFRFDLQGVLICRPAPIVTEAVASPADVTDSTGHAVKEP